MPDDLAALQHILTRVVILVDDLAGLGAGLAPLVASAAITVPVG